MCLLTDLPSEVPKNNHSPGSILLITLSRRRKKSCGGKKKSSGDQAKATASGARDDRMISRDLMGSDGSVICRQIQRDPLFQYLTRSLKEDNDGRGSSFHKAALSAHRGRCGDVVTGKAGCVSKQELPALCIAALALQ